MRGNHRHPRGTEWIQTDHAFRNDSDGVVHLVVWNDEAEPPTVPADPPLL